MDFREGEEMTDTAMKQWKEDLRKAVQQWNRWHYQMHLDSLKSEDDIEVKKK
jgi:hypothetical protein